MPMHRTTRRISLSELGHRLKVQIVAEVPVDLSECEFDCGKSQCDWVGCERRISKAAGGLMPSVIQQERCGSIWSLKATVER